MEDETYKNAFKEVYVILQNTDYSLIKKIPEVFISFIEQNMNANYTPNIDFTIDIDKQLLLPETENVLSFIYRSYWALPEEKVDFKDEKKEEFKIFEKNMMEQCKDVNEIFCKKHTYIEDTNKENENFVSESVKKNLMQQFFKLFKKQKTDK